MSFERQISEATKIRTLPFDKISAVEQEGQQRGQDILDSARKSDDPVRYIQEQFAIVTQCASPILDNFTPNLFIQRKNDAKPPSVLEKMLLGAHKTVACISVIERGASCVTPFADNDVSEWYKARLNVADNTYETDASTCRPEQLFNAPKPPMAA